MDRADVMRATVVSWAKGLVVRYVPPSVVRAADEARARLRVGPLHAPAVVQPYFADGRTRSYVRLHNFYSALVDEPTDAVAHVRVHDSEGRVVVRRQYALGPMASRAVDVRALLDSVGRRVDTGVVTVRLVPRRRLRAVYRSLGLVTSHFFVQHVEEGGSLGVVHPLATEVAGPPSRTPFRSSQLVSTEGLAQLEVLVYNPTHGAHRMTVSMRGPDGEPVSERVDLPPMSARLAILRARESGPLTVECDAVAAPNAKPILRRRFASGLSSMSHA